MLPSAAMTSPVPMPLLLLLLPCLSVPGAAGSRALPVVSWDDPGYQQLQLTAAVSRVQCGARCLRSTASESCVALAYSGGQCRLLTCPPGHSATDGVCQPDCPAGTVLQNGECIVQCQTGWSGFGNACYLRVTETRTWALSEAHCGAQLAGAHLASIQSSGEEAFVWGLMSSEGASPVNYHIGFEHLATEPAKTFHWLDGTSVGYTNWRNEQPNFDQTRRLGTSVYASGSSYAWCDVDTDASYTFQSVCKFDPSSS